jgi:hypothetical protein
MSFILPVFDKCDVISFYVRSDFTNHDNMVISHYIKRDDIYALPYYIKLYLDTNKKDRRPDTPATLIIPKVPPDYLPEY